MNSTRKIVGMGETILDILFRGGQPVAAVPGGSTFNSIISVGRTGVPCAFVGYTGADTVGRQVMDFMHDNGVDTEHFLMREGEKSAISLAFLSDAGDASYLFYNQPPHVAPTWTLPEMHSGDVLLYGSYYAICPGMRPMVEQLQQRAARAGAIVYYDLNFRRNHHAELDALMPAILDNFRLSTIVRGSADDFEVMYASRDARDIYNRYVSPCCPYFICTAGAGQITVCTPTGSYDFQTPLIDDVVSTVGAGDNFNAGFSCALIWLGIMPADLLGLDRNGWQRLVDIACSFAGEACRSTENYIGREFAQTVAAKFNV